MSFLNRYSISKPYIFVLLLGILVYQIDNWKKDIVIESTYLGRYNKKIHSAIVTGFFLFLLSELMLFGGFFWAFFDRLFFISSFLESTTSLNPSTHPWVSVDWFRLPVLGTLALIASGYVCNLGYYNIKLGLTDSAYYFFAVSILLGVCFLGIQEWEYLEIKSKMSDGIFPSLFFLLTGFHGFHVIVGLYFLAIESDRIIANHYTVQRVTGLSLSVIYWHFVDVIWLFLFVFVYFFNNIKILSITSSTLSMSFFYYFV